MTVHAGYRRGQLVYYEDYLQRVVDAVGNTVRSWVMNVQDFQPNGVTGTDPRGYITTVVEAGAGSSEAEASDEAGQLVELVTDNFDNDGLNLQLVGEAFHPSGRDLYFGIKLEISEATQCDFFVGLAITDTDCLGGVTDGIYFEKLDGGTGLSVVTEKDSVETQTDNVAIVAANVPLLLELYCDAAGVGFYVNGATVAQHTANIPDDEALTPTIQFLTGDANAKRMKIAWARAFSIG